MQLKSFRARTLQQALELVRSEFGAEASVLHTREVRRNPLTRLLVGQQVEVVATPPCEPARKSRQPDLVPLHEEMQYRERYRANLDSGSDLLADELPRLRPVGEGRDSTDSANEMSHGLFEAYTDLIEADVEERTARGLVDLLASQTQSSGSMRRDLRSLVVDQIATSGPIAVNPGQRRLAALVGPTGVGKTTTIAKLAANFRLREKKRVGLITVDTYRVAAVEQLRTYADIIDLPMEVVATPREMREAVARMTDLDLVLLDTAGRSPKDEVQIQELKSMLGEAQPDEVHLVLSSTAAARSLVTTADRFADVGVTSLLLTKLDEAMSLGHLLSLFRSSGLPVSYLTNGQNVPDDISVATAEKLGDSIFAGSPTY